jgi:hypothetical protein
LHCWLPAFFPAGIYDMVCIGLFQPDAPLEQLSKMFAYNDAEVSQFYMTEIAVRLWIPIMEIAL